jgi:hypothetical protein
MAAVDRVARRSLTLHRTARKVQRIRADEGAETRRKCSRGLERKEPGRLSYEYDDWNLGLALIYLGELFHPL